MTEAAKEKCIFCDIVAGKAPAHIIAENDLAMCILDLHPYTKGHCLVISKRHVPWWHELTDEENAILFKLAKDMAGRMMEKFNPDFVFLYARGRRIPHTHLFLIPTYSATSWIASSTPSKTFRNLRKCWQSSKNRRRWPRRRRC